MVALGLFRIVFKISLSKLLTILYAIIFILVIFSPKLFLGIAFDPGAATTGSMTVPFILALGLGVASTEGGRQSEEDSFGLLGIASAGPMLAVLSMGIISGLNRWPAVYRQPRKAAGAYCIRSLRVFPG